MKIFTEQGTKQGRRISRKRNADGLKRNDPEAAHLQFRPAAASGQGLEAHMSEPIRYIVESIGSEGQHMFRDLGIMKGDIIEVPDGFPSGPDLPDPGEPVTLTRELHPNVAWFLGSSTEEGMVGLRRVTSEKEVAQ